ncbi:ATP-binding protein [Halanaerobium sp. ST460_2HS_T2]|uniref:sensor histidine kinase n=1 Tax=Halanaerobium sp. ST460_2HS_T2 TaxID=2183914 RepID=UPI000DF21F47|nr:ATP-binding protein [Halanaerobium sp. ST460_2HS_T2]RCW53423.1 two-component system phosphate regulon sensor histidine kinase PhoR/two-component system sensor histidine kinase ResE [Halanaerobium sp. ST460_2HS_T2]
MKLNFEKNTFFTKLIFRFLVTTMIVILIFGFSVITYFKTFFVEQKEAQINKNSSAVIEYLADSKAEDNKQEIVNWLSIIGELNEGHAWLINQEGVLEFSYPYSFDEERTFSGYETIFKGNTISREVDTEDFELTMLFVGMPVEYQGEVIAALLVFTPIDEINSIIEHIVRIMIYISLVALIFILFISYYFSRSLANPLHSMGLVAARISQGEYGKKVEIKEKGASKEIKLLSESINLMSEKLERTIKSLAEEKNKLKHVLSGMEEGIIAVNSSGRIILTNQSAASLFNFENDIRGEKISEIELYPEIVEVFQEIIRQKDSSQQQLIINKEDTNQYYLVHFTAIKLEEQNFWGGVAIFHDISERYRFEQLQREFVANVSHELKSPLSSIKGSVEILLDGIIEDPAEKREYLKMILKESNSLSHLIDETLTLAEIDAGGVELNKDQILLQELFANLQVFFKNIKKEEQSLEIKVDPDLKVTANQEKIRQVLINLLSNSVKYSDCDGKISLKAERQAGQIKISVADNGIGIPQAEQQNIWERFYKVDKARTPGERSSGLGLAIVNQIVNEHQGQVAVESSEGEGSTFSFTIPVAEN